ncbi:hypothetical protein ACPWT1_20960 [Ramlibacter sp. MMS24-I3-19]|uniref:hypothetical protein n=1 Tax=Ramlibacter sp. MMS24-I3-19 TaxID=3416606 RepID=UPI003D069C2F
MPLLLDDADDLLGSAVILLLSACGVLDDDDELELLPEAPIDWALELPWEDALDLLGSSDILALSEDDVDEGDVEAAGELLLVEGEVALAEGEVALLLEDGAPIDWVLDELSLADWLDLFSADFLSESSLADSTLSLAFSAVSLVFSVIFLAVSLIRSVIELPDDWLSVADGVEPGLSCCCAKAPVPARASVQASAMKVRFMGISLRMARCGITPRARSLSLSETAGFMRRSGKSPCPP